MDFKFRDFIFAWVLDSLIIRPPSTFGNFTIFELSNLYFSFPLFLPLCIYTIPYFFFPFTFTLVALEFFFHGVNLKLDLIKPLPKINVFVSNKTIYNASPNLSQADNPDSIKWKVNSHHWFEQQEQIPYCSKLWQSLGSYRVALRRTMQQRC